MNSLNCVVREVTAVRWLSFLAAKGGENVVENAERFLAAFPFGFGTEEIFFGDHFENGTDVLGHAAVNENEAVLQ